MCIQHGRQKARPWSDQPPVHRALAEYVVASVGMLEHGGLKAGQTVVIHGAQQASGLMLFLARRACLRCVATAGTEDIDCVRFPGGLSNAALRR